MHVVFQDCLDWSNSLEVLLLHDFPSVLAQSITPTSDGTGSIVIKDSNQYNIPGSIISKDGTKLFPSFQQLELNSGQIAKFLSYPEIRNIVGWVVGGDPSLIRGLI